MYALILAQIDTLILSKWTNYTLKRSLSIQPETMIPHRSVRTHSSLTIHWILGGLAGWLAMDLDFFSYFSDYVCFSRKQSKVPATPRRECLAVRNVLVNLTFTLDSKLPKSLLSEYDD